MQRLHVLFSLFSFIVIFVTIERFSFTTRLFLPPMNFIRLHEVIQTVPLTIAATLIFFLLLAFVTNNFSFIKKPLHMFLLCVFITGVYLYGAGEGSHEIASFALNTFCKIRHVASFCGSMFINDYYFGNILYFLGGILMTVPLVIFERNNAKQVMTNRDITLITMNAIFYAFGLFAYAAFDVVVLELLYC